MMAIRNALIALTFFAAFPASAETLTNESIVMLSKAGLGSEAVIAKIKASPTRFDLSTEKLVALKSANVSDMVIAAMLEASTKASVSANAQASSNSANPLDPHAPGVYVLVGSGASAKMMRLDPTTPSQTKTSGALGAALSYGLAKRKVKSVLANPSARVRLPTGSPAFYFYFDQSSTSLSNGAATSPFAAITGMGQNPVTSPNEFTLLKFEINESWREVDLGSIGAGGMKMGAADKQRVAFTYEDVAPGVFKVTTSAPLASGEYGFIFTSSGAGNMMAMYGMGGQTSKIFDFGVNN